MLPYVAPVKSCSLLACLQVCEGLVAGLQAYTPACGTPGEALDRDILFATLAVVADTYI